jgi:carbamoyltransferase
MLTVGVKVSHDGAVALVDGNRLVFSVEVENLDNSPRYSKLGDLDKVAEILRSQGVDPEDVDQFVVDGWWPEQNADFPGISTRRGGDPFFIPTAPYVDGAQSPDPLQRYAFSEHDFNSRGTGYVSYHHVSNHVFAAYCTSPFAQRREDSLVLVWDGGTTPRLYQVDVDTRTVTPLGALFTATGDIFTTFCANFDPFRRKADAPESKAVHLLSVAGKAMAYAALGTPNPNRSVFPHFDRLFEDFAAVGAFAASAPGQHIVEHPA